MHQLENLHAILAREAPVAVLFRRGPSDFVQLLKWNLSDDTFEHGQWLNGRIYERRARFVSVRQPCNLLCCKIQGTDDQLDCHLRPPYLTAVRSGKEWEPGVAEVSLTMRIMYS